MAKKSTGKRILTALVILVLVIGIGGYLVFRIYGNRIVKFAIEKGGTQALQVDVNLEAARLQPVRGVLELDDLAVANPEGYGDPHLLTMGSSHVALNASSLMEETVEIDQMVFKNVSLYLEQKGTTSNLKEVIDNLPKAEPKPEPEAPAEEKPGKNLLIKKLVVEEVRVTVKALPLPGQSGNLTLRLAPIHLTDIGTEERVDIGQLAGIILNQITKGVIETGRGQIPTEMLGDLADQLQQQGRQILEEGRKTLEETGKGILEDGKGLIEEGEKTLEGFRNLIPGRKEE